MGKAGGPWLATGLTVGLILVALWSGQHPLQVAGWWNADKQDTARWAVALGAVGVAAGAQVVLISWVVGRVYERDVVSDIVRLAAAVVAMICLVGAIALGLASR